jgi:hypothetical protein
LRKTTGTLIDDLYDKGEYKLSKNKYTIPISVYMKVEKTGNVDKLTKLSGVGLRLQGGEIMQDKKFRRPKKLRGNGLTLGGSCCMCGGGMDDNFFLSNQSS